MRNTWNPTCGGYIPSDNDNIVDMKTESKPFPTFADYEVWFQQQNSVDIFKKIYNYFAKFAVREVFPEVGKKYEFSNNEKEWFKMILNCYDAYTDEGVNDSYEHIRPIQPSRLEQLKARKSELSKDELLELIELMETTQ
jgi:hypothetical protein